VTKRMSWTWNVAASPGHNGQPPQYVNPVPVMVWPVEALPPLRPLVLNYPRFIPILPRPEMNWEQASVNNLNSNEKKDDETRTPKKKSQQTASSSAAAKVHGLASKIARSRKTTTSSSSTTTAANASNDKMGVVVESISNDDDGGSSSDCMIIDCDGPIFRVDGDGRVTGRNDSKDNVRKRQADADADDAESRPDLPLLQQHYLPSNPGEEGSSFYFLYIYIVCR
jgi:hypothetical protein